MSWWNNSKEEAKDQPLTFDEVMAKHEPGIQEVRDQIAAETQHAQELLEQAAELIEKLK